MNLSENNSMKEKTFYYGIILVIILAFSFWLFNYVGIKVVLSIVFVSLPFYFILNNFNLTEGENILFSLLLGFTIFSSLAYTFGLVMSFRIGIILAFLILMLIAYTIKKYKPKKTS